MSKTTSKKKTETNREVGFDFKILLSVLKKKWYWVVISFVVFAVAGYVYVEKQQPVYERYAVLQIKNSSKANGLSSFLEMNEMGEGTGGSMDDELYIIRSVQILQQVVKKIHLDVAYSYEGRFRDFPIYKESPIIVSFLDQFEGYTEMKVSVNDEKTYDLVHLAVNGQISTKEYTHLAFNDTIQTEAGKILVRPVYGNLKYRLPQPVKVTRISESGATGILQGAIQSNVLKKGGSLVKLTCRYNNVSLVDAILDCLTEEYTNALWSDKKRVIESTAEFIDERIKVIGEELGNVEKALTDYKQRNQIVSVEASAGTYLNESSTARAEVNQIQSQISVAEYIKNYVEDRTNKNELVPNVSGVGDANVQSQITAYNELMIKRNRLALNSSESSPVVKKMNSSLDAMRTAIVGALANYLNTLNIQLNSSLGIQRRANSRIASIPMQESYTVNIERQQEIKAGLYTFLLNKREETAMQLSATETDIRIIEKPFGSMFPVAPVKRNILGMFFLIGIALPLVIFVLRQALDPTVHNKKELKSLTAIPNVGLVPALKGKKKNMPDSDIVVGTDMGAEMLEALHILKSNLSYMGAQGKEHNVLLFTSGHPGAGKSYVSANYAAAIASTNQKVIWVDMDIRKRHTVSFVEKGKVHKTVGLTSYLSGSYEIPDIIVPSTFNKNLDVILAGPIPPNPIQLLLSEKLDVLVNYLRQHYDSVILDNVPMDMVADASIVNRVADVSIYVIRACVTNKNFILDLNEQYEAGTYKNLCTILNGVPKEHLYGYGYGYGYGNSKK